ncbi:MAG: beta-ketoacyl-[acyl-carrier-protein] synthase family protein [Verrucomicrobiota bacterium]|nr:beta-ketoacyl-[acyl-carrier-protein] synthase family protein [Verrucomicrobiota bacterium]
MHRVVVTGLGVVSALGQNAQEFGTALRAGRSGIGPLTQSDMSGFRFQNGAEVSGFDPAKHFAESELLWLDRFAQFGIVAAREAIADSGLDWTDELRARTGVVTGSCLGGMVTEDAFYVNVYRENKTRVSPTAIPRIMSNAVASHVAMQHKFTGPTFTLSTACSSANHAIGHAFWLVRQGTLAAAVTGGSEAPLVYGHLRAWEAMRVVAADTCRPFSKGRTGMILGEGGAMLVLENMESARARGAKIYAEIVGFGMSADAHHLTQPLAEGAARAITAALADGALAHDRVHYINAHGTGTEVNDAMETKALRLVFGAQADRLAVSSTKSMHGHTLGAAGAVEAVATMLAFEQNFIPPTANFVEPDPLCDLDVVPNEARAAEIDGAVSNSFAFGGLNAVLAFRRFRG